MTEGMNREYSKEIRVTRVGIEMNKVLFGKLSLIYNEVYFTPNINLYTCIAPGVVKIYNEKGTIVREGKQTASVLEELTGTTTYLIVGIDWVSVVISSGATEIIDIDSRESLR